MRPILSILTAAVWERMEKCDLLSAEISGQIGLLPEGTRAVEHLVLLDNRMRSVGLKRQALLDIARGDYIAFVDDDDAIAPAYVSRLVKACMSGADVVTFAQRAVINGAVGFIRFDGHTHTDPPWKQGEMVKRAPWHVCAWRRDLVKDCLFTDRMDGEDLDWCRQARRRVSTTTHIDAVLHTYQFDSNLTQASGRD